MGGIEIARWLVRGGDVGEVGGCGDTEGSPLVITWLPRWPAEGGRGGGGGSREYSCVRWNLVGKCLVDGVFGGARAGAVKAEWASSKGCSGGLSGALFPIRCSTLRSPGRRDGAEEGVVGRVWWGDALLDSGCMVPRPWDSSHGSFGWDGVMRGFRAGQGWGWRGILCAGGRCVCRC
jgi:hypothetical protein